MSTIACCGWWLVLGVVIGWLLSWLFNRLFGRNKPASFLTDAESAAPAPAASLLPDDSVAGEYVNPVESIDVVAAARYGFSPRGVDDLIVIEGIGPKIAELLKTNGIDTFAKLARADVAAIRAVLEQGGARFKLANPDSWPQQAELCARNDWEGLKALQDKLTAGVSKKSGKPEASEGEG
jgi:predicted flap endonuclease-1-like 5' DNA nuclease